MGIRKPSGIRRSEIIAAVLDLADAEGPDRLSTAAIAEEVGITQPAIFRHFATKDELWRVVAEHIRDEMKTRWAKVQEADAAPLDLARNLIRAQLTLVQTTPAITAILFSRELQSSNDALRGIFGAVMRDFHKALAAAARQAVADGSIAKTFSAEDVASLLVALAQGMVLRWTVSGRAFDLVAETGRLLEIELATLAPASGAAGNRGKK